MSHGDGIRNWLIAEVQILKLCLAEPSNATVQLVTPAMALAFKGV